MPLSNYLKPFVLTIPLIIVSTTSQAAFKAYCPMTLTLKDLRDIAATGKAGFSQGRFFKKSTPLFMDRLDDLADIEKYFKDEQKEANDYLQTLEKHKAPEIEIKKFKLINDATQKQFNAGSEVILTLTGDDNREPKRASFVCTYRLSFDIPKETEQDVFRAYALPKEVKLSSVVTDKINTAYKTLGKNPSDSFRSLVTLSQLELEEKTALNKAKKEDKKTIRKASKEKKKAVKAIKKFLGL